MEMTKRCTECTMWDCFANEVGGTWKRSTGQQSGYQQRQVLPSLSTVNDCMCYMQGRVFLEETETKIKAEAELRTRLMVLPFPLTQIEFDTLSEVRRVSN